MKLLKTTVAWVLILCVVLSLLPAVPVALAAGEEYSISNKYLTYSFNKETGGFALNTKDGHPQKSYDDNMPLLYKDDAGRSNGTSFVSVRIDGKDYIFGQDYSYYKLGLGAGSNEPNLEDVTISEEGRLISIAWTIKDITVIKKVALSLDEDSDTTGNAGIAFEVINHSGAAHDIGIRLLLDTALGNAIDAPYIIADTDIKPTYIETMYEGDKVPAQLRNVDALSNPRRMSYLITKGWTGSAEPNKIIIGHWANMANTRYDYTADKYCDFTNYSNEHRTADSAVAVYWETAALADGGTFRGETLYGVGNFSASTNDDIVSLNVTTDRVELAPDGASYLNDGVVNVAVEVDNTHDDSVDLVGISVKLGFDENDFEELERSDAIIDQLNKGDSKLLNFKLKAKPQAELCAGEIFVSISGVEAGGDAVIDPSCVVENMTERSIILPSVKGLRPEISLEALRPQKVYYKGTKAITLTGNMKGFDTLSANQGWDLYLVHVATGEKVLIAKADISFLDENYTSVSFRTDEELYLGDYTVCFEFADPALKAAFGDEITTDATLESSPDPRYANPSYGIIALVRNTDLTRNVTEYDFYTFADEGAFQQFYDGKLRADGELTGTSVTHDFGKDIEAIKEHEILVVVKGDIREMTRQVEGSDRPEKYWQAKASDGDIIINNILSYEGDKPLELYRENNHTFIIKGDGLLKVVNSITVWRSEWKLYAQDNIVYSLDPERLTGTIYTNNIFPVELGLEGAASLIQSIGGFLIDLHYGLLSSEWFDDSDGRVSYGIDFGGMAAIPIADDSKTKEKKGTASGVTTQQSQHIAGGTAKTYDKRGKLRRKSTGLTDGQVSAEITSVRYGEMAELQNGKVVVEDIGFVGIDTTVSFGIPQNVFGSTFKNQFGLMIQMRINTINNIYTFDLGVSIKIIECAVHVSFKEATVGGKVVDVVPDALELKLMNRLAIPIGTPGSPAYLVGLGGGISNLADTIGGNYVGKLPPVTVMAYARIQVIKLLIGDFELRINPEGLAFTGILTINDKKEILEIKAGVNARFKDPWSLDLYGNINVLDGIIQGGLTVTLAEDYFYGYVYAAVYVPDTVPVVGGRKLAGVEGAVSNEFIGANVEIIGIKFGVIYYWGESVEFSDSIDLSPPAQQTLRSVRMSSAYVEEDEQSGATIFAGSNTHDLSTSVQTKARALGSASYKTVSTSIGKVEQQDNLLFVIPYSGGTPAPGDIVLVNPNGSQITMTPDDGKGGGNFALQYISGDGSYMYISVTDKSYMVSGDWTLKYKGDLTIGRITVKGVDNISDISGISFTHSDSDNFKLNASWNVSGDCEDVTSLDIYLCKDPDILSKIKTADNKGHSLGEKILHLEDTAAIKAGAAEIIIPASFDNGEYYVVAMLSTMTSADCVISSTSFTFTNPNLPKPVKSVAASYGANGDLLVEITDADTVNYTDYLVEIVAEDGTVLQNNFDQFSVEDKYIYIGKDSGLVPGKNYFVRVRTLREESISDGLMTDYFYGSETVKSNIVEYRAPDKPVLLKVEVNYDESRASVNQTDFEVKYTFDRPVWFGAELRGQNYYYVQEYHHEWYAEFNDLEDGDYFVDFVATGENGDYITGEDYPAGRVAFNVDTSDPVLSLAQKQAKSLDDTVNTLGGNVIISEADGSYVISGITEGASTLTIDGSTEGLTVENQSTFTYKGKLAEDEASREHILRSVDKAGNVSELVVTVVHANATGFVKLILMADGKEVSKSAPLEVPSASSVELSVVGVTANGERFAIPNEQIEFSILYHKNTAYIQDGKLMTYTPGETAVKAKLPGGTLSKDADTRLSLGLEDYITVKIVENTREDLEDAIAAAQTVLATTPGKTAAAIAALEAAIAEAQRVFDDPAADGPAYTTAVRELNDAVRAFQNSAGTVIPGGTASPVTSANIRGEAGKLCYFDLPAGTDGNTYAPYYVENGVKKYVRMSAAMDGRLYFIAPADGLYYMEDNRTRFDDISGHWAEGNISYAAARDIFNGVADRLFDPNGKMTRAMFVTVLGRLCGIEEADYPGTSFTDVEAGQWYSAYVEWAAQNGIVDGYGGGLFGPDDPVTREQMCVIIARFIEKYGHVIPEVNTKQLFNDNGSISGYALDAVYYCQKTGLVEGKDGGLFDPAASSTRAEVATLMKRLVEKLISSVR